MDNEKLLQAIENNTLDQYMKEIGQDQLNLQSFKLQVKFVNKSNNPDPAYAKDGDSGFDLRAFIDEPIVLKQFERFTVPTGLYLDLPSGFDAECRSRSGLASKHGVMVLNSPGTVDNPYIGEIKVILINFGKEDFVINNGDRIAQCVIGTVSNANFLEFEKVDKINRVTERGDLGFGSSGVK